MFSLDQFKQYCFHDGIITEYQNRSDRFIFYGEFPEDETERSGYKYFFFSFRSAEPKLPDMGEDIIDFEICEKKNIEDGYSVRICTEKFYDNHKFILAEFGCKDISFKVLKYRGMSYRNLYGTPEYDAYLEAQKYVLSESYFTEKEQISLPEGFSLELETYSCTEDKGAYSVKTAFLQKCTIRRDGQTVYEYLCTYGHAPFHKFIYHKNGHRYYPFHVNLYGISYIDVDTLEVYSYIPEGYQHDDNYLFGESFIITDIHYDPDSGLIAYGGCFWAGPGNVMVGDFTYPPYCGYPLADMQELIDPHYDQYDELDFERWNKEKLWLKCEGVQVSAKIDEIKGLLRTWSGS